MQVKKSTLTYAQTAYFSKLILDYLEGNSSLRSFYTHAPKLKAFKMAMDVKREQNINRELLVEVIEEQYKQAKCNFPASSTQLLLKQDTFTVTTGHQLCLFSGPLYFIYKIISTINLAEQLSQAYPESNFVPVFWMASEDHDFAEVNHIHLFGKKIEWNPTEPNIGAMPVGKIATASVAQVLSELAPILGNSEHAQQLMKLFENAYSGSKNLSEATRILAHELFGKYGLVILDADDKRLKAAFSSILLNDIQEQTNFKLVNESIAKLEELGYKSQVNPREINSFYIDGATRERILVEDGKYRINNSNKVFTLAEITVELQSYPERFSPNVVLRPLYQEYILPNLAYIGGGGELAYWLEYKAMFDFHNIQFPILILRNSLLWIESNLLEKWNKFNFSEAEFFSDVDVLVKEYIAKNRSVEFNLAEEQEKIKLAFSSISEKVQKIDSTLKASAEGELQKALSGILSIENKVLKAEKQKQETTLNQIKKSKEKLFPQGELQERYENLSAFYSKYGIEFIEALKANLDPLDFHFTLLTAS
jgi:bacillithiol synthase